MKKVLLTAVYFIIPALLFSQPFTGSYSVHIDDAKRNQQVDLNITVMNEKSCLEIITEERAGKFRTIINEKDQSMTLVTEKEGANKFAMIRRMSEAGVLPDAEPKEIKIMTTNERKIIDGFSCFKVIVETDDVNNEIWLTLDVKLNYADVFGIMNRASGPAANLLQRMKNIKNLKGAPLEMTITDKKLPDEITHITLKNIKAENPDASVFDLSGYQVMDLRNK